MKKNILIALMLAMVANAFAVEVEINGLWYELVTKIKEAKVIQYKNDIKYSGNIVIPETVEYEGVNYSVVSIGDYAFYNCKGLNSVTIPGSMTFMGRDAFMDCKYMTSVFISDLEAWCKIVYSSGDSSPLVNAHRLFLNGKEIKDLEIPNSVTAIGVFAFSGCSSLTSVVIPNSVTSIGQSAFQDCTNLKIISIPNSVTSIGLSAFQGCNGLNSITVPNSVTNIEGAAFKNCTGLTSVMIPNSVTSIEGITFYGCSSLTSVMIPNSVTRIDYQAFYGCSSLTSVMIPNSVTSIEWSAFYGCTSLTTITIGNGVKTISEKVFSNCPELTDVYCYSKDAPSTNSNAFEGSYVEFATLHVPASSINKYKSVSPWSSFKNIVKIDMPKHILIYMVDDEVYRTYEIEEGENISPETEPTKEGYTFSGWSEIPKTMPAHDVTVTGSFSINSYKLTYMIDDKVYKEMTYEYGATITPEPKPEGDYDTFEWKDLPQTMPAHDVVVYASYTSGIVEVLMATQRNMRIYTPNGKKLNKPQKGLNIIVLDDGTVKKVIVK